MGATELKTERPEVDYLGFPHEQNFKAGHWMAIRPRCELGDLKVLSYSLAVLARRRMQPQVYICNERVWIERGPLFSKNRK